MIVRLVINEPLNLTRLEEQVILITEESENEEANKKQVDMSSA